MKIFVLALLLSGVGQRLVAQRDTPQELAVPAGPHDALAYTSVEFSFVPRLTGVQGWTIRIDQDRSGKYQVAGPMAPVPISVSTATMTRLLRATEAVTAQHCETKTKNIAQTGQKTLSYAMGTAVNACTFNYSDDAALNEVAMTFQAIAETLEMGEKIAHDRRFDHLGLNADLESLTAEAKAGRAIELQNIAPLLQSLVENDELMDVVRRRSQSLLQDATLGVVEKK